MVNPSVESTTQYTVSLFGGFQVTQGETTVSFATDRARALLAYLAVEANQPHRREALAALLWPDDHEKSARQNLSQTLTRVRQAIGDYDVDPPFFLITRPTLQVNHAAPLTVDLLEFQNLLATSAAHSHGEMAECPPGIEQLTAAVALYQGPFLDGTQLADSAAFDDWILLTRQQAQRQALEALDTLTKHHAAAGNHQQAQAFAAQQLAIEPWQESAHRQLMLALARNGQRSAALAQFESCRRLLDEELAVEPEAATIELAEQIRSGEFDSEPHHPPQNQSPQTTSVEDASYSDDSPTHFLDRYQILSRLEGLPDRKLFGIETARAKVEAIIISQARPWLIAIDGIGGVGKTTLADLLVRSFVDTERFADIAWISAKQEEFRPDMGIAATGKPALDSNALTDGLLEQLMERPSLTASSEEKRATLMNLLKERSILVVVDNLETVADYQALIPYLRQLSNPSKFLITTRLSLQSYPDVFCYSLTELEQREAVALLRYEAEMRNVTRLSSASQEELEKVYQVVGGNPLALMLVLGQVKFLSVAKTLENLREAQGKKIDQLYLYIYWQAWEILDNISRQLFLSLPLIPDGTFADLEAASGLNEEELQDALTRLIDLSLLQVGGKPDDPSYRLHRLTETFLLNEVAKWQLSS